MPITRLSGFHRPPAPRSAEAKKKNSASTRAWQERRVAAGLCKRCGKPRGESPRYCPACVKKNRDEGRERMRRKSKCEPWRPGKAGRPPIDRGAT